MTDEVAPSEVQVARPNVEIRDGVMYVTGAWEVVREDRAFHIHWPSEGQPRLLGNRTEITVVLQYASPHPAIESLPPEFVGGLVVDLPSGETYTVPRVVCERQPPMVDRLFPGEPEGYSDPPPHRAHIVLKFIQVYVEP